MGTIIWIVVLAGFLIYAKWFLPYDSTDDAANRKRSGMTVYVDHATGLQYIGTGLFSGVTLRVKADGTPYTGAQ